MPFYLYRATNAMGKTIEGGMEAQGERAVVDRLHSLGYIPVKISLPKEASSLLKTLGQAQKVSAVDSLNFTQELCTLLNAGFPMDRSLSVLVELTEKPRFKNIIKEILRDVEGGSTLAKALGKHPDAFSRLYVNMVMAGETGGFLPKSLEQLVIYLQGANELRNYVVSAMIYPAILSAVSGASIIILLAFVIPRFAQIFNKTGVSLPLATQILLVCSEFVRGYWWAILAILAAAYWSFQTYTASENGRLEWDRWKLRWVLIGNLVKKIEVARFCRTMGTLIKSGIPILSAISIARETLENSVIRNSLDSVHKEVKEGGRMADVLRRDGLFPALALHMITVGEESGDLDSMLLTVATTFEGQVRTDIKKLVNLIEPAMILFMGLTVGFIVLSMLLAIFSVNEMPF